MIRVFPCVHVIIERSGIIPKVGTLARYILINTSPIMCLDSSFRISVGPVVVELEPHIMRESRLDPKMPWISVETDPDFVERRVDKVERLEWYLGG